MIISSILIGAASHLFWNRFTHTHSFSADTIPGLTKKIEISGRHVPVFIILQHLSTLIGGLVVVYAVWQLKADKKVTSQISLKF